MPKLIRIERTESIYEVELTEEQYKLSEESDEGFANNNLLWTY